MKRRLDVELDFSTDLSPLELASRVAPLVREAVEKVRQSLGTELEFDIFLDIREGLHLLHAMCGYFLAFFFGVERVPRFRF